MNSTKDYSMTTKVAIVTGANKGIGIVIVRGLCKRFEGVVYLTSRDVGRGKKAVQQLQKEGLTPKYHQLDITNKQSLEAFRDHLKRNYNGIDVLINNAAISFARDATEPVAVQAEQTLLVNYFSLLSACTILFPLLKPGARVINMTSTFVYLYKIPSAALRKKFTDPKLTIAELSAMMHGYIDAAKQKTRSDLRAEWGGSSYGISKVGVTALTMIQHREFAGKYIKVNAVHPGYVKTDMTSHKGLLSADQGAEGPLYLALDAPDSVNGQFVWFNEQIGHDGRSQRVLLTRDLINLSNSGFVGLRGEIYTSRL